MELQWQRQAEQDALLAGVPAALQSGGVLEVQGLQHLERILEAASGQLVVLTVYSRCAKKIKNYLLCSVLGPAGLLRCRGAVQYPPPTQRRRPMQSSDGQAAGARASKWDEPQTRACKQCLHRAVSRRAAPGRAARCGGPDGLCLCPCPRCRLLWPRSSCGICKGVLRELEAVCGESRRQRARIVFLRHDLHDAFDWPSDVARMYALKSAPRFLFFVDVGAAPS